MIEAYERLSCFKYLRDQFELKVWKQIKNRNCTGWWEINIIRKRTSHWPYLKWTRWRKRWSVFIYDHLRQRHQGIGLNCRYRCKLNAVNDPKFVPIYGQHTTNRVRAREWSMCVKHHLIRRNQEVGLNCRCASKPSGEIALGGARPIPIYKQHDTHQIPSCVGTLEWSMYANDYIVRRNSEIWLNCRSGSKLRGEIALMGDQS